MAWDDQDVLRCCSLVCAAWTPRSQRHLLRSLTLSEESTNGRAGSFEARCSSLRRTLYRKPELLEHVRSLILRIETKTAPSDLLTVFKRLRWIKNLSVISQTHELFGIPRWLRSDQVTMLILSKLDFEDWTSLVTQIVSQFPALFALGLQDVVVRSGSVNRARIGVQPDFYIPMLHLTSIETLTASYDGLTEHLIFVDHLKLEICAGGLSQCLLRSLLLSEAVQIYLRRMVLDMPFWGPGK
jgi:hypothetical protein